MVLDGILVDGYGLDSWLTLLGECLWTTSSAHSGNKARSDAVATGAILFF